MVTQSITLTVGTTLAVKQIIADKDAGVRCAHCGTLIPQPPATPGRRLCPDCTATGKPLEREVPF